MVINKHTGGEVKTYNPNAMGKNRKRTRITQVNSLPNSNSIFWQLPNLELNKGLKIKWKTKLFAKNKWKTNLFAKNYCKPL